MIHVIITYTNQVINKTSAKNSKVAQSYIDAVLRIYKHDGILEDVKTIETVDYESQEHKVVYPVASS
jgi:DNA replication protein DnaD